MVDISIYGQHPLTIASISRLFREDCRFQIQVESSSNKCKNAISSGQKPDVIVYCATNYSNSLFIRLRNLHKQTPDIRKVLVISVIHRHFLKKLMSAGIDAIVSNKSSTNELHQAVVSASLNQQYLSQDLSLMTLNAKQPSCFNALSQRELEITYLLANGMNVKNVSSELDISPKTVNTYRYRIFNKLDIERNIDLFRLVSEQASYMLNK